MLWIEQQTIVTNSVLWYAAKTPNKLNAIIIERQINEVLVRRALKAICHLISFLAASLDVIKQTRAAGEQMWLSIITNEKPSAISNVSHNILVFAARAYVSPYV